MYNVFKTIVQFNIQACFIVLAIIILRLILKKAPRSLICALWTLVAVRLIFPFRIESVFSLVPDTEITARTFGSYATERITSAVWEYPETFLHTTDNTVIKEKTDTLWNILPRIAAGIWAAGVAVMLIYAIVSYLRLYRMTRENMMTEKGVYICDRIPSPFILGIIRPKIFLPSNISEHDKPFVLAHEKAHIKRKDHLWKPLGFVLLSVYWFNPLLWAAYILLCRDIESACDEKVIKELGDECKKPYAIALINSAASQKTVSACPLAFGETNVKSRIKNVLSYKKPAFWIIIIAVVLSISVAVCFLTNPIGKNAETDHPELSSPTEPLLTKLEPYEAVDQFFKANADKFPMNPTNHKGWTWANVKDEYYGGTYIDGAEQVILLTDTSQMDDYAKIGMDIRYEKCEYSYEELNGSIKEINSHIGAMSNKDVGYSSDIKGVSLDEQRNRVIVDVYQLTDEKTGWFKEQFGNKEYYVFRESVQQLEDEGLDTMTVSTDLPTITYADDRYVYLDGDCGVVIYDYQNGRLIHRIPQSFLRQLGFTTPYSNASADGQSIIIFGKDQPGWIVMNVESGEIIGSSGAGSPHDFEYFEIGYVSSDIRYGDDGTNHTERHYITKDGTRYTLRVPEWKIKNTELTVTATNGSEKIYYIFE